MTRPQPPYGPPQYPPAGGPGPAGHPYPGPGDQPSGGYPYPGGPVPGGYPSGGPASGGYPYPGGPASGGYAAPQAYPASQGYPATQSYPESQAYPAAQSYPAAPSYSPSQPYPGPGAYGQFPPGPGGYPPVPPSRKPVWPWIAGGVAALLVAVAVAVVVNNGNSRTPSSPGTVPGVTTLGEAESKAPAGGGGGGGAPAPAAGGGFGERQATASGLTIEVARPEAFEPSEYAAGHDRERAITVTTTVVNDSDEPYELNGLLLGPQATHGGRSASQIIDLSANSDPVPLTTVLPGKSFTYEMIFSVGAQPAELQLEYTTDFLEDPLIFTGQA